MEKSFVVKFSRDRRLAMNAAKIEVGEVAGSWGFLGMSEEEVAFYRRFVARHGGALVAMGEAKDSYRLDFPPGTRIALNEELGVPLEDSYHIVYPRSEEHTSELRHVSISYAVFCL